MPPTCAECGSSKVVQDDLYSESTLVCEDCGSIVPTQHLTTTRSEEEQGTSVPYYASTETTKHPSRNLIKGIKRVQALCRIYRFSGDLEYTTVELFKRAYAHPAFLMAKMERKEVLGGACMVAVARMNNKPVTLATIGSLLEADPTSLGTVYQELVSSLQLQVNSAAITELLESYCHGLNLTAQAVGEAFSEKPSQLTERATSLVELAGDAWLVTGRNPLRMCLAVTFLAWQSFQPAVRMKVSVTEFCRLANAMDGTKKKVSPAVLQRVRELREVLCKLGAQLPWLRGVPPDPHHVAALVEDILKYKRMLLARTLRSHEEALEAEHAKKEEDAMESVLIAEKKNTAAETAAANKKTTGSADANKSKSRTSIRNANDMGSTDAWSMTSLAPEKNVPPEPSGNTQCSKTLNASSTTVPHSIATQSQYTPLTGDMAVPANANLTPACVLVLPSLTLMIPQGQVRVVEYTQPGGLKRKAEETISETTPAKRTDTDGLGAHEFGEEEVERPPSFGPESRRSDTGGLKGKAEEMLSTMSTSAPPKGTDALGTHELGGEEERKSPSVGSESHCSDDDIELPEEQERSSSFGSESPSSDDDIKPPEELERSPSVGPESHCSNDELPADHWSKRQLFVPPCVSHPKRRLPRAERGPDVTGDEEISDSEIESYLRSPQEAQDFSQAQNVQAAEERFQQLLAEQKAK
ncbi:transcription factor IIIB 50 kDa subunit [Engraulis encrasicolus]|uniref:transcription factor IIIB 50 kDa subunit n=1 Tax=Engraulis encrasicolus TaxID=184585 RepID=UPI002FD3E66C